MTKGWTVQRLDEVADQCLGKMLDKSKNKGTLKPYLRNLNVRWFEFELTDVQEMRFEESERDRYTAIKGDVLICEGGYPGRGAIWQDDEPIYIQKAIHRVRFHEPARAKWFLYFLHCCDMDGSLKGHFTGTGIQHFTGESLRRFRIPLPPLSEQKRIVAMLDEAFEGIATAAANAEKNLANARELFDSHLNATFLQKGKGWSEEKLEELIEITHGYAFDGNDFETSEDPSRPIVLTPGNYTENAELIFTAKNTKRFLGATPAAYRFNPGDLTVVMTDLSSKMKILGKPAFVERTDVLHNQRIGRVSFKSRFVNARYLFYFLRTQRVVERIKETATGTMVRHTAPKRILGIGMPLPPDLSCQSVIVARLDGFSNDTKRLEVIYRKKLAYLAEMKQSILERAFAGELTGQHERVLQKVLA